MKSGDPLRKIGPLRGTLVSDWMRCGKPSCACARGRLHGPYLSLRWREGGRQRRHYVRRQDAATVLQRLAAWRTLHPPAHQVRQELAQLRRLLSSLED
jgi:hypothetical protein